MGDSFQGHVVEFLILFTVPIRGAVRNLIETPPQVHRHYPLFDRSIKTFNISIFPRLARLGLLELNP